MRLLKRGMDVIRCFGVKEFSVITTNFLARKVIGKNVIHPKPLTPEELVEALGIDMRPKDFRPVVRKTQLSVGKITDKAVLAKRVQAFKAELLLACAAESSVTDQINNSMSMLDENVESLTQDYIDCRQNLMQVAKDSPLQLTEHITSCYFYSKKEYSNLNHSLVFALKLIAEGNDSAITLKVLQQLRELIPKVMSNAWAYRLFSHLELIIGIREKMSIAIYDHAFQFAGGGQRYMAALAEYLQDEYDITYITNKGGSLENYKEWFDIDLSGCQLKNMPIEFFEQRDCDYIDEGMVIGESYNPFDEVAFESLQYDVFINANMLGKVEPRSLFSIFIGHFPHRDIERYFHVPKYDFLIGNGDYSSLWLQKQWLLEATHQLYPPVDMYHEVSSPEVKKKLILSAARFDMTGSKKQLELVRAFSEMCEAQPGIAKEWKLVLTGGSFANNQYLAKVKRKVEKSLAPIEVKPNAKFEELKDLYKDAAIFWHACGLDETSPELIEHFGMTTVEAMQNYCVPIVIDGGGQVEIVHHGECGYRFSTLEKLKSYTCKVIEDQELRLRLANNAYASSHRFNLEVFQKHVGSMFEEIKDALLADESVL